MTYRPDPEEWLRVHYRAYIEAVDGELRSRGRPGLFAFSRRPLKDRWADEPGDPMAAEVDALAVPSPWLVLGD